jgi:uncharacterized membrane protein
MQSKAKILGHPIHPMLIVFPLGLLMTAVIFDVVYLIRHTWMWAQISYYLISAGLIGGLVAGVVGLIDWLAIPRGTRAKWIGTLHGLGNLVMLSLFASSWLLRQPTPTDLGVAPFVFSFMGVGLALVTAWLGGELVDRLAVGVDTGANLNAPSSLGKRSPLDVRSETIPHYGNA